MINVSAKYNTMFINLINFYLCLLPIMRDIAKPGAIKDRILIR
jgi:hypothetical protein